MGVTGFLGAWLTWEHPHEWRFAIDEAFEGRQHVFNGLKAVHSFGTTAKFTGSLRPAQKQLAKHGDFRAAKLQRFIETMLILRNSTLGAACRTSKAPLVEPFKCISDGALVKAHNRIAVRFLVAGIHQ